MLAQRLAVAAVGLPLLALLIAVPEPAYAAAVEALLAAAAFEMVRAVLPETPASVALLAAASVALFAAVTRVSPDVPLWSFLAVTLGALVLLFMPNDRLASSRAGWWMIAVLYVGVLGTHLILIRSLDDGQRWLVLMLAATFATDTGAYAVGRLVGRRRLWPAVSPNKTWEGAAGGLLAGTAAGAGAYFALDLRLDAPGMAILALGLPLGAIAGDLLESALKRKMGVKDMSHLLPGHGGLLDRMDSILLVGVCLYWIARWLQT